MSAVLGAIAWPRTAAPSIVVGRNCWVTRGVPASPIRVVMTSARPSRTSRTSETA
jgi:hypothetical protein